MRRFVPTLGLCVAAGACTAILGDDFSVGSEPESTASSGNAGEGGEGAQGGGSAQGGGGGVVGAGGDGGGVASVCGDGAVEGAETCDDGGTEDGDGCDAECTKEWSCVAPGEIELTIAAGVARGSFTGNTLSASDELGEADCGGTNTGRGGDHTFAFTTVAPDLDVFVTLRTDFDGLVRITDAPCNLDGAATCADALAGPGTERAQATDLAAGTHYLTVDGADAEAGGSFTVDVVVCNSDPRKLRLTEIHLGQSDYAFIHNPSDCPVHLQGLRVFWDDRDDLGGVVDCTSELGDFVLEPGAEVKIAEDPLAGDIDGVNALCTAGIPFNPGRGWNLYLCEGTCTSATVIDMARYTGPGSSGVPPAALPGTGFSPTLAELESSFQDSRHFYRVATLGTAPSSFRGNDWAVEQRVVFDDFETTLSGWVSQAGSAADIAITSATAATGNSSVRIAQTGPDGKSMAIRRTFPITYRPRMIRYHARVAATDTNAGTFDLVDPPNRPILLSFEPTGFGLERENNQRTETPYEADTWYRVDLRNVDFTNRTMDFYVDGVLIGKAVPFFANSLNVAHLELFNNTMGSVSWFDGIEMWQ